MPQITPVMESLTTAPRILTRRHSMYGLRHIKIYIHRFLNHPKMANIPVPSAPCRVWVRRDLCRPLRRLTAGGVAGHGGPAGGGAALEGGPMPEAIRRSKHSLIEI